jgi:polysaccharide pyruvyl transferase WcaK-like protein
MKQQHPTVGLLDHLGHGNLGDEATLYTVRRAIESRKPGTEIIGLSLNPQDTESMHGIRSYAIRRDSKLPPSAHAAAANGQVSSKTKLKATLGKVPFLLAILRAINTVVVRKPKDFFGELSFLIESFLIVRRLDLLVICGGGQLLDTWGGPWSFPYTLYKWTLLAKLSRVRCYFINVGAGPLSHPLSKSFIKRSLGLAEYASFRDAKSRTLVTDIGFKGETHVVADNVYSLDVRPFSSVQNGSSAPNGSQRESVVGIAPMCYCDPRFYWDKNQQVYDSLIQKLGGFAASLLPERRRVQVFSTDIRIDAQAIEDLKQTIQREAGCANSNFILQKPILTTDALLTQLSSMDYVVTCRFHGVIFAHLMNIPVIAVAHHPKVTTLMADLGLSEYCLDIYEFDADLLKRTFDRLVKNRDNIKSRMAEAATTYRSQLAVQYDQLFPAEMKQ